MTTVNPPTLTTDSMGFGSLGSGISERTHETVVVVKPTTATAIATGLPPGRRIRPRGRGNRWTRIAAANIKRYGMKNEITDTLTMTLYAPCTPVPIWLTTMNTTEMTARKSNETYGVPHRGCRRPNAGGKY